MLELALIGWAIYALHVVKALAMAWLARRN